MINAEIESAKEQKRELSQPRHYGKSMHVSSTIATMKEPKKSSEFDYWLELRCIGNKLSLDLPVRLHNHFHKLNLGEKSKFNNDYIISPKFIQFSWTIDTGLKRKNGKLIGIDSGINALASLPDGTQFGTNVKNIIDEIKRCEYGSKHQKRVRRHLKQRIDEVVKEIFTTNNNLRLVVVENLKKLNYKTKTKRRLSKNMRRSLGAWAYRYWLNRLQQTCERNRVSFRSVSPRNTSRRCSACDHIEKANRNGKVFLCKKCGFTCDADVNAARNILFRFLTGPYGAGFKDDTKDKLHICL